MHLLEPKPGEVQLIDGRDLLRRARWRNRLRKLRWRDRASRTISDEHSAGGVEEHHFHVGGHYTGRQLYCHLERITRSKGDPAVKQRSAPDSEQDPSCLEVGRRIEPKFCRSRGDLEIHRRFKVRPREGADVTHRIPMVCKGLHFVRLNPAVIGLVIRKGADH